MLVIHFSGGPAVNAGQVKLVWTEQRMTGN
jgi:hypothetical protein